MFFSSIGYRLTQLAESSLQVVALQASRFKQGLFDSVVCGCAGRGLSV